MQEIPAEAFAAAVARIERGVAEIREHAESNGGFVRVESDASGRITELNITQDALAVGPAALGQLVISLQNDAHDRALAKARELRRELTEDPRVARLADRLAAPQSANQPDATQSAESEYVDDDEYFDRHRQDPLGRQRY